MKFQKELDFAIAIALEAAVIAREKFSPDIAFQHKADNSPLTEADLLINQLVVDRCRKTYPTHGVLSEELAFVKPQSSFVWVCDPIDGTIPYTLGMPVSTFCLALVEDGIPQIGVVHDFMSSNLYSAVKGEGVWRNDVELKVQAQQPMHFVALEWWHVAKFDLSGVRERLFSDSYQVPNFASGAFTSVMVALGRINGLISATDKPWDIAAAKVIVEELGGRVTDLFGQEQRYDGDIKGAVVTNKVPHEKILKYIRM